MSAVKVIGKEQVALEEIREKLEETTLSSIREVLCAIEKGGESIARAIYSRA